MKNKLFALKTLVAASVVACAAAFIIQTLDIYLQASGQIYTSDIVSDHFKAIIWAPILMFILVAVGAFLPYSDDDVRPMTEYRMAAMLKRSDTNAPELAELLKRMKLIRILEIAIAAVCTLALLIIGTQKTLLIDMDLEASVGQALPLLMIPVVIMFVGEGVLSFFSRKTADRIIETAGKIKKIPPAPQKTMEEKKLMVIRLVLYAAAAACIVAGIINGGIMGVLVKASVICTECIGLG